VVLSNIQTKSLINALMYEAVDSVLGVDPKHTKNWSAEYLKAAQQTEQEEMDAIDQSAAARIADAPASHPLKDYIGTYTAPGYADIPVKWQDDKLKALFAGEWLDLVHYHYDVFELVGEHAYDERIKVSFSLNNDGAITQVHVPIEPSVGDTVFTVSPEMQS
jgi:hypothetical protein